MPVHDWTLVDAGIVHAFHVTWVPEISRALNGGLLPGGYYALPEQHAGMAIADVLTLHASPAGPAGPNCFRYRPPRAGRPWPRRRPASDGGRRPNCPPGCAGGA